MIQTQLLWGYLDPDGVSIYVIECEQRRSDDEIRQLAIQTYGGLSKRLITERTGLDRVKLYNSKLSSVQYKYSDNYSYPWWIELAIEAEKLYYVGSTQGRAADRIRHHIKKSNSSARFFDYFDINDIVRIEVIQTDYPRYVARLREWETAAVLRNANTTERGELSKMNRWIRNYSMENLRHYLGFARL